MEHQMAGDSNITEKVSPLPWDRKLSPLDVRSRVGWPAQMRYGLSEYLTLPSWASLS